MKKTAFKILSLFAVIFCFGINTSFAGIIDDFSDVDSSYWSYNAIMDLKGKGILVGYPDGTFKPDENVTRAEFSTMVVKALNLRGKEAFNPVRFKDLSEKHWAYNDIQTANHYGIMYGTPDNNFMPQNDVKRVEVIMTVMNTLNLKELTDNEAREYLAIYKDADTVPYWALKRTGKAQMLNMIVHKPGTDEYIYPDIPATRGELALFIYNMLERVKVHPSKKLQTTMPKMLDGYVLENVYFDGNIAIIPAGTVLPLGVMECIYTKTAQVGDEFTARTLVNFVSKDKILLIPIGREIKGTVQKAQAAKTLFKNAQLVLETNTLLDEDGTDSGAELKAVADARPKVREFTHNPILQKIGFLGFKGHNFYSHESQQHEFVLLEQIKIDVMNNWLAQ